MRIAKKAAEFGFKSYDRRRLANSLKQVQEARSYRRLHAILLVAEGRDIKEVAQLSGTSLQTIYNWIKLYLQHHHPESLFDSSRSGRPRSATALTDRRIISELNRDPLRLGYNTTVWTVPVLATHLSQRFGCEISPHTLRRRMKQLGLRWKRPRYVYSEKELNRAQKKGQSLGD